MASATWELRIPAKSSDRAGCGARCRTTHGDGFMDVAIGAVPPGRHLGLLRRPYGIHAAPDQVLGEGQPRFGQEVAPAGDVNGDGFVDLAVSGTPAAEASPVTIYYGGPQGLTAGTTLNGRATNFGFAAGDSGLVARAMSTAGDENGDGYADLLAGDQARGHLFRGGRSGINQTKCPTSSCPTDSFSRAAPTSTATASPTLSRPTRSAEPAPGSSR